MPPFAPVPIVDGGVVQRSSRCAFTESFLVGGVVLYYRSGLEILRPKEDLQVKITADHVQKIAYLARLRLDAQQSARFQKDLNSILDYVDLLDKVDTNGVEPTVHSFPAGNALREDTPVVSQSTADALANAPAQADGSIVVPRVLE